jgi:Tol biopolymer transport system component
MAQRFDVRSFALTGEATPIADHIQTNGLNIPVGSFSASDGDVLAYQAGEAEDLGTQLAWLDRAGNTVSVVGPRRNYFDLEVSPDGKQATVSMPRLGNGGRDVWMIDLVRGVSTRFTFQAGTSQTSVWSPDGKRIVFNTMIRGSLELFQKPVTGGAEEPLLSDGVSKAPWSWSAEGKYLVYSNLIAQGGSASNLWVLPLSGDRKPFRLLPSSYIQLYGRVSPDGQWIAFASDESNQRQVYITSFPDGGRAKYQVSIAGGTEPRWRGDGKELFFVNSNTLLSASVNASATGVQIGVPKPLFQFRNTGIPRSNYGVRPDGQRFLFNLRAVERASAPITVVMNWDAERE